MPRARKGGQQIPTPSLGVSDSVVTIVPSATRTYPVAMGAMRALTDGGSELISITSALSKERGIRFDTANQEKLYAVLLRRLGTTIEIQNGEVVHESLAANEVLSLRIDGKSYPQVSVDVSMYDLVKDMFGKGNSGFYYNDLRAALDGVLKATPRFLMRIKIGKDSKGRDLYDHTEVYAPVISVTYLNQTSEQVEAREKGQVTAKEDTRMRIHFHPIATYCLPTYFAQIPINLEEILKKANAGRVRHTRLLAYLILGEKNLPRTKGRGYFEYGKKKLVKKLSLEKYLTRPAELGVKLRGAFEGLTPELIKEVVELQDQKGVSKFRIYPTYEQEPDPKKTIENGAA